MKKLSLFLIIVSCCLLSSGVAHADRKQAAFAVEKAKVFIEKVKAKSDDLKASTDMLKRATAFAEQAETTLKTKTTIIGTLNKEAEQDVLFYAEMAEIHASSVMSRLEKGLQEKENARLEKMIPEIESKIRTIDELKKPQGSLETLNAEVTQLRTEKTDLAGQLSRLKTERDTLALKGSSLSETQAKFQSLSQELNYRKELDKLDYLMKASPNGSYTYIIPRRDLIKMSASAKSPILAYNADRHMTKFADLMKAFPEHKIKLIVYGSGNPPKQENLKATEAMAKLLKAQLIKGGVKESSIEATGGGLESPMFSKGAVEENRRVEITLYPLQKP